MSKSLVTRFEVKEADEDAREFTGLAATWDLDLGGDIIQKGAFKRTLKNWQKSKRPLPLLDSHNAFGSVRNVIGKMTEATETDDGLEATFKMIDGPDGEEVFRRVRGGFVDGLSIGYEAVKTKYPERDSEDARRGVYRYLEEVKLREVSVVLWPMNDSARIDTRTVKSMLLGLEAKDGDLTTEEKEELTRIYEHIGAMLKETEKMAPPEGPTPEQLEALNSKIADTMAAQLSTRLDSIQHWTTGLMIL